MITKEPIPPLNREVIINVDATPDGNYAMRILKAYLENAEARYVCEPPQPFWDAMNEHQAKREVELRAAIAKLES